jgi:hypothetical protein
LREIEAQVAADGWDQPVRLFALFDTEQLLADQPGLRPTLGDGALAPITSVEQDTPPHDDLADLFAHLAWSESVFGLAVVAERIVIPSASEQQLPANIGRARAMAADDPHAHDVRLAAAVTRAGDRLCLLRWRDYDDDSLLMAGPDLMQQLTELIAASLTEDD